MKTVLDMGVEVYKLVNVPVLTNTISGGIYRNTRPADSDREDIVVNTVTLGDGTRQHGIANINIYAKDICVARSNILLADTSRLKTLTELVKPLVEEIDGDGFALWLISTKLFSEPLINQHFMNLRIEVQMYNFT
ncbi:hypothetical protein [Dyadobacter sp. LHD-138]|uniref:hypothetical protein n=1 Tax=Dyadobacter sp. LHD-138 TaxID=3071413 RepID=UPI0027E0AEA3|nr:hypothetical protein [Dyadobacter sp. LHD-138]MDQ6482333.1 hypothetical protein [Dyadobacter sp. LHD-138]